MNRLRQGAFACAFCCGIVLQPGCTAQSTETSLPETSVPETSAVEMNAPAPEVSTPVSSPATTTSSSSPITAEALPVARSPAPRPLPPSLDLGPLSPCAQLYPDSLPDSQSQRNPSAQSNPQPLNEPTGDSLQQRVQRRLAPVLFDQQNAVSVDYRIQTLAMGRATQEAVRVRLYLNDIAFWPDPLLLQGETLQLSDASLQLLDQLSTQSVPAFRLTNEQMRGFVAAELHAGFQLMDSCPVLVFSPDGQLSPVWLLNLSQGSHGWSLWLDDTSGKTFKKLPLHQS